MTKEDTAVTEAREAFEWAHDKAQKLLSNGWSDQSVDAALDEENAAFDSLVAAVRAEERKSLRWECASCRRTDIREEELSAQGGHVVPNGIDLSVPAHCGPVQPAWREVPSLYTFGAIPQAHRMPETIFELLEETSTQYRAAKEAWHAAAAELRYREGVLRQALSDGIEDRPPRTKPRKRTYEAER